NGDIGTDATTGRLQINAANAMAQAPNGSVWITDTSTGDLGGVVHLTTAIVDAHVYDNSADSTFSFNASGLTPGNNLVTTFGTQIHGSNVVLTSSGGFSLGDTVGAGNEIDLVSNDSILNSSFMTLSALRLGLWATGNASNLGVASGNRLVIDAPIITLN